ncbi:MAG: arginine--tRNA ligase [Patescibacteria group bacterium]|nr:arginine--tRNA ligase [Patescibacteria group bacterium]
MEEKLKKSLKKTLNDLNYQVEEIIIGIPKLTHHGDFYTPLALQIGKKIKKNPLLIAQEIVKKIPSMAEVKKIIVVPPGFINFYLSDGFFVDKVKQLINKSFKLKKENKTIVLEFGQPNTHKIPHIGHLYSYIYGESLARILEFLGNKVIRVNYQGDIGLHVAKCLWAVKNQFLEKGKNFNSLKTLKDKVDFLQKGYQEGSQLYEENKSIKKEIDQLNLKIYQKDSKIIDLWQKTRQWSLDFYKIFEKKLGIKYDRYYFESQTAKVGKKIILENLGKVFEESNQAIIFKGEKHNLHTRVFINSYGNPTYEAKDIGLAYLKNKDYQFDLSIITTAKEQNEYWKVIIKVIELLFPHLKNKISHLGFGMVNLTSGKMSSRSGNIIDPFTLTEEVKKEIKKTFLVKDESLLEKITFAAIKYSFLNSDYKKNIIFDLKKSIAKEGNSGPYLLYTYVRTKSVLTKSENFNLQEKKLNFININNNEERKLLKKISFFSSFLIKAKETYSPNIIANYLYELASLYNLFYQKYPILKAEESLRELRLLITLAVKEIIKNGLNLLGIETVEKM